MRMNALLCCGLVCACFVSPVHAVSKLSTYLKDGYKDAAEYQAFFSTVDGLKSKCDVCHKPGADKKAKDHGLNDFGQVYHERFNTKDFQTADKIKKTDEAMKVFKEAWEKSLQEKNAEGKLFGDLIKEGKVPGKID